MNGTSHGHRHSAPGQHEHEHEPQYGLPEALPADEQLLWQGSPVWTTLAVRRFHVRKLVIYFALLLAARMASLLSDGQALWPAVKDSLPLLALSAIAVGLVTLIAWFTASTTVYTLTNRRVVMRIGIVLTITLNLPLRRLEAADLRAHTGTTGDVSLRLLKPDHIAYLHLWPHARAWRLARPEPTLLCVADAAAVARQLTNAWQSLNPGQAVSGVARANPVGQSHTRPEAAPTLATR